MEGVPASQRQVNRMFLKQLSIFVENKHGRLAEITGLLTKHEIDIRALSIADTTDYGILRLIVDKPDKAKKALQEEGFTVSLTNVIAVAIDDTPGALANVVKVLCDHEIGIEYVYAFLNPNRGSACVILRVENNEAACEVLGEAGIRLMNAEDVSSL